MNGSLNTRPAYQLGSFMAADLTPALQPIAGAGSTIP
jgi:hypothetical protein